MQRHLFRFCLVATTFFGPSISALDSTLGLSTSLRATSVESDTQQARSAGLSALLDWNVTYRPWLKMHVEAGAVVETGMNRARYAEEFAPSQGIRLREAVMTAEPLEFVTLTAGAIDQNRWNSRILLWDQSFPGVLQEGHLRRGDWHLRAGAQQSIVADASLVQPWGDWQGQPASFFLERIAVSYERPSRGSFGVSASHFLFSSLSSHLADRSRYLGNRIDGFGSIQSRFASGFQGYLLGLEGSLRFGRFTPDLRAEWIANTEAPSDGEAWRAEVGLATEFSPDIRARLSAERFDLGARSVPAAFNDRALGHVNRVGYGVGLNLTFPREGIDTTVRYVRADRRTPRAEQSDLGYLRIEFGIRSDLL